MHRLLTFFCLLTLTWGITAPTLTIEAMEMNLTQASILVSPQINANMHHTIRRIVDLEVQDRTKGAWKSVNAWDASEKTIAIVPNTSRELLGRVIPSKAWTDAQSLGTEGYAIYQESGHPSHVIWLLVTNDRSIVFALGDLLRQCEISPGKMVIDGQYSHFSTPAYPIRGHQIGYRNTANSYDAWSVEQYEDYIRELALFGTNAIENIPFGKDDSPHMTISRAEMNRELSRICQAYDLDYWVWTPASFDLTDRTKRAAALAEHDRFYQNCPRLNEVFFPGGDPGHNHPRHVMPFLKDLSRLLKKHHPEAGIWISLQGFSAEQVDYFYEYLRSEKPDWLRGVVSGPSSPSIFGTRFRLPDQYKHRHYPDITHSVRCDYPAEQWDQAFALTLGREGSNPQPFYYAQVHASYAPFTDGFVSYSDGCHDDINKFVWSQRGWDPRKSVRNIIEEYTQFFFGHEASDPAADGILALERNWAGALAANGGVEMTLAFWQSLEQDFPNLQNNWRWQMLLMRAYYDAYTRRRLLSEQSLEQKANDLLRQADVIGSNQAMQQALKILGETDIHPIAMDLRKKIVFYCDALFKSVGLQTDWKRHQASGAQRGCVLTFVDHPLNNRWWLEDQFKMVDTFDTEKEKVQRLSLIANWELPGHQSYYDNVSNIAQSPHVKTTVYDATDFAWWDNGMSRRRLSSQTFQNDPVLEYEGLDPNGRYLLRVCGYGEALARVDGYRINPIKYDRSADGIKEFVIPRQIVGDGRMKLTFDQPEESTINWRQHSKVSDVWLIKR